MDNPGNFKKLCVLLLAFAALLLMLQAAGAEQDFSRPEGETGSGPESLGNYTICYYFTDLEDIGYKEAVMLYPCEAAENGETVAATTLTGGFTNEYDDMEWLFSHLASHGYVVLAMTPNNKLGVNWTWRQAHKAGLDKIEEENQREESPIYGMVDTDKLQIMGFSKGGGGALQASKDVGDRISSTQALAPYMDHPYDITGIESPTICYTGTEDSIAGPGQVVNMYNNLPDDIERTLAYFNEISHTDWYGGKGDYRDRMKTYITSWMKYYLDGDEAYFTYLYGPEHQQHMNEGWFYEYARNEDSDAEGFRGCGF